MGPWSGRGYAPRISPGDGAHDDDSASESPQADRWDLLLHGVAGFDGCPPQAGLLGHDENVEWGPRGEGVHEVEEAGTLDELGTADAVVDGLRRRASHAGRHAGRILPPWSDGTPAGPQLENRGIQGQFRVGASGG